MPKPAPTAIDPLRLVIIRNPFDRRERDERLIAVPSAPTVEALVGEYLPAGTAEGSRDGTRDGTELVVSINGEVVPRADWGSRRIVAGDQMVAMPVLHDDDGVLGMVLSIGLMIVAPGIGAAIAGELGLGAIATFGSYTLTWGTVIGFGVSLLGSAVIGALTAPDRPNLPGSGLQSYDASPSYAWQPVTTQTPGGVVARAYGTVKLHGNIIAGYIENTGDTGREQTAHLLIDLGQGPYSALREFKINGQPVNYYNGVSIVERLGALNQTIIPAFDDTRLTRAVGAKVVNGAPVTRNTIGNEYDALEIVVAFPQGLYYANDSGGMDAVSVEYTIEISADAGATWRHVALTPHTVVTTSDAGYWSYGFTQYSETGGWVQMGTGSSVQADHTEGEVHSSGEYGVLTWHWISQPVNIYTQVSNSIITTGSSPTPIRKTFRADNLTRGITYQVRATNLSADQTGSRYGDDLYLAEINEVLYDDFTYPRTALVGVRALATDQLSGGLQFECIGDAAIVRVWNGSAWSSAFNRNPAWIIWDILTQPVFDNSLAVVRYDGRDPSTLILADFYAFAQWCDTAVPISGGSEPRCVWDGVFDTAGSVWDAALEVAASARAVLLMRGTSVTVVYDHARTVPAQVFSVGNTAVSSFRETFLPMADRASAIEVDFMNADDDHNRDKLTIVNADVTEAAAQRVQFSNRGIRRPTQTWREAMFRLKRNELLTRSAEIGVDIDALACTAGDLIWVQDDVTQWGEGGRIVSGTTTTLVLDKEVTLEAAKTYDVVLRMSDDTIVTRAITTAAGTVSAIEVGVAFPATPAAYDVWAIGETGRAVKEFICTDVRRDSEQRATLSLIEYNASLYNVDSGAPTVPTANISPTIEPAVTNLAAHEVMERSRDNTLMVHLDLSFDLVDAVKGVAYIAGTRVGESIAGIIRIANVTSGATYTIQVRPETALGLQGSPANWQSITTTIVGEAAIPSTVTNVATTQSMGFFSKVADVDVDGYQIRAVPGTLALWSLGVALHDGLVTDSPYTYKKRLTGINTIMVAAVDRGGRVGVPGSASLDFGVIDEFNIAQTYDYKAAGFPGTIGNASVSAGDLVADSDPSVDIYSRGGEDFYTHDGVADIYGGSMYLAMSYLDVFSPSHSGGELIIDSTLAGSRAAIDWRVDGSTLGDIYSGTDIYAGTDLYGPMPEWQPYIGVIDSNADWGIQFRVSIDAGPVQGQVTALSARLQMPAKDQIFYNVGIAAAGTRLAPASGVPAVEWIRVEEAVFTVYNDGSGAISGRVADFDPTLGPLVQLLNAAGTAVTATGQSVRVSGY